VEDGLLIEEIHGGHEAILYPLTEQLSQCPSETTISGQPVGFQTNSGLRIAPTVTRPPAGCPGLAGRKAAARKAMREARRKRWTRSAFQ
jgi:hypothetical protein